MLINFFNMYKINLRMEKENTKSKEILLLFNKIIEENCKFSHLLIERHFSVKSFKYIINL